MQADQKTDQNQADATQTQHTAFVDIRPFEDCVLHALVAVLAEVTNYFPDTLIDELKRRAAEFDNRAAQMRKSAAALNAETRLNVLTSHHFKYPQLARIRIIHHLADGSPASAKLWYLPEDFKVIPTPDEATELREAIDDFQKMRLTLLDADYLEDCADNLREDLRLIDSRRKYHGQIICASSWPPKKKVD